MDLVDDDLLRSLTNTDGADVVVTLAVDVNGHSRPRLAMVRTAVESLLHQARKQAGSMSEAAGTAVEDDARSILEWVDGFERAGQRGVVLVASGGRLVRAVELDVSVPDGVSVGRVADVRPLLTVRSRSAPTLLVLADHERARLLLVGGGTAVDEDRLVDFWPRHVDSEKAIGDLNRAHAESDRRHLRRVAEAVDEEIERLDPVHLALGGPAEAVAELAAELSPGAAALLIGTVSAPITSSIEDLVAMVDELREGPARRQAAELAERFVAEVAAGRAAIGLADVLQALAEARVRSLLVAEGFAAAGRRCPSCGTLSAMAEKCPACGEPTDAVVDIVPSVVATALAQRADIELVDAENPVDDIAAIERY